MPGETTENVEIAKSAEERPVPVQPEWLRCAKCGHWVSTDAEAARKHAASYCLSRVFEWDAARECYCAGPR
jgi:hypothetical protein